MRFEHFQLLDSTNAEASRRANAGDLGALWISAHEQTHGKGRRGRDWVSQKGNVLCTGLYSHDGDLASAARLSFAAALAAAESFSQFIADDLIQIKWPNDILIDGKKAAGILLESGTYNGALWIAIGIGMNIVSSPDTAEYRAAHMHAYIKNVEALPNAQEVIAVLAQRFDFWRQTYNTLGFEPLRAAWLERSHGIGRAVTVNLPRDTIKGTAIGMDMQGALEVKTNAGEVVKIHAGDVFFS